MCYVLSNDFRRDMETLIYQNDSIIKLLKKENQTIMADLTQLTNDVAAETTVEQSAIKLLNGLSDQLKQAGTDPAALQALDNSITTSSAALAAAVAANTPAAPAPPAAGGPTG